MTSRFSTLAIAALLCIAALPVARTAAAQSYPQDNSHYLRLPSGYQDSAPPLAAPRPLFSSNAQAQPQQTQQQGMMPAPQAAPATAVSSRLLPPEMAQQPMTAQPVAMQMQPVQQMQPQPMQQARPAMQPTMIPAAPVRAMPVAQQEVTGGQTNVQMRPACDVPANHRALSKGMSVSTTVGDNCLN